MKAVILAGGLGTRMHPLTSNIPKPMLPYANKPIMQHTVEYLKRYGITDMIVLLHHQPETIMNYFGDGSSFGVKIIYVVGNRDLGTAGAVKYAQQHLDETFVVISADIITDIDLGKVMDFHRDKHALITITLASVENPLPYGIVITDGDGKIKHFIEKPSWGEVLSDTVNTGIYIINPIALDRIPEAREFDFSKDLFPRLLEDHEPVYGHVSAGYWKDIGSLAEYGMSHRDIVMGKIKVDHISQGRDVQVSPSAELIGLVLLGDGCIVGDNVVIENSVIGSGCEIGRGTRIFESILWDGVKIEKDSTITRAVVASNSRIEERSILEEGCVVASNCKIGPDTHIKPYVKIWPGKNIDEGSTVSTSIVWRERWAKKIFGAYGVTGICNVEITPEFAATLGAAYGVMIGKGSSITTSRDPHRSSRMIYRALLSGVLSAGVNISDLEMVPLPLNRHELKAMKSSGGFHVRRSPFDPSVTDIKFFDSDGMDLSAGKEKAVERMFFGEDFERASSDETGELSFPFHRVAEMYKEGFLSYIDRRSIVSGRFKFAVDYAFGSASQIFPAILGELKCDVTSINAFIDENKITKSKEEFERSLVELSKIVKTLKCDFGVMFDAGAEKIFLVDENGRMLSGDTALAVMTMLNLKHNGNKLIGTPVTSSRVIDDIARSYGGKVTRTKTSLRALMEASATDNVAFVGERQGGYIFPKFQVSFDSMVSTAKLLEYLAKEGRPLSEIVKDIPTTTIAKAEISCPNNMKGKVMRSIIESNGHGTIELIDGVKMYHKKDWALVLPRNDSPSIRLEVEASDESTARRLLDQYVSKIHGII